MDKKYTLLLYLINLFYLNVVLSYELKLTLLSSFKHVKWSLQRLIIIYKTLVCIVHKCTSGLDTQSKLNAQNFQEKNEKKIDFFLICLNSQSGQQSRQLFFKFYNKIDKPESDHKLLENPGLSTYVPGYPLDIPFYFFRHILISNNRKNE